MRKLSLLVGAMLVAALTAFGGLALAVTLDGTDRDDDLRGTNGEDNIDGKGGNDTIRGLGAKDNLDGDSGNDLLYGGDGDDNLDGDSGNDRLYGGAGSDTFDGRKGNDLLVGGPGKDYLDGQGGNDRIDARDGVLDYVDCGAGNDRVTVDARDDVNADCENVLKINVHNGNQLQGSFATKEQAQVDFDSRIVDAGATLSGGKPYNKESTLRLVVGGSTLTFTVNPEEKTIARKTSDRAFTSKEIRTFDAAGLELTRFLKGDPSSKTNQEAQLLRALAYLSEVPAGKELKNRTENYSGATSASEKAATTSDIESSYTAVNGPSAGRENCEMKADRSSSANFQFASLAPRNLTASAAACEVADEDGVSYLPCANDYNVHSHDACDAKVDPHGFLTYSVRSGPTAFDEYAGFVGRCGPQSWGFGYTQDCLDHDICVMNHGAEEFGILGDDLACGDEFDEAYGDFWISVNECRYREQR